MLNTILIVAILWMLLFLLALISVINYGLSPTPENTKLMCAAAIMFVSTQFLMQALIGISRSSTDLERHK